MSDILITGGTGSLGQALVRYFLARQFSRVIVFSRDEYKQHLMRERFSDKRLRFFLGDVRDIERLRLAFRGVTDVIHTAALKHVYASEYQPWEYISTNVIGTDNVARAAFECGVSRVLLTSTDKAVDPINLYGATKMTAERLLLAWNNVARDTSYAVVRYGNVLESRGGVFEHFVRMREAGIGVLPVRSLEATRFYWTLDMAAQFIGRIHATFRRGTITIPKMKSCNLCPMVLALGCYYRLDAKPLGITEKMHESLMTKYESNRILLTDEQDMIIPPDELRLYGLKKPVIAPEYTSDKAQRWTVEELQNVIQNLEMKK